MGFGLIFDHFFLVYGIGMTYPLFLRKFLRTTKDLIVFVIQFYKYLKPIESLREIIVSNRNNSK